MLQNTTDPEERELIKFAANTLYAGGTDTITASIAVFFLAMTLYPEVQKKAQREIDEVIGKDRLPCLADRDKLPYLGAVYKEVLRWQSIGPVGKTPALTVPCSISFLLIVSQEFHTTRARMTLTWDTTSPREPSS